jgi:hypothetical protein
LLENNIFIVEFNYQFSNKNAEDDSRKYSRAKRARPTV